MSDTAATPEQPTEPAVELIDLHSPPPDRAGSANGAAPDDCE
jgi:hypothetical protein